MIAAHTETRNTALMKTQIRAISALGAMIVLLAACTSAGTGSPSASPEPSSPTQPSVAPSEAPSEAPSAPAEPNGTLTVADGAVVDGPGTPLAEALTGDLSQPVLVRGTLYRTTDGEVFMAASLDDASAPTFGGPIVRVANYPTDGPTWDMASAELIGLEEANGIRFFADTKLYGTISQ
jgi:hypothetical protein